ncbi:methyl-CpG-binding domain-containing protein 5-like [Tasmannia lanceolata]|uniref:methyl-CpG-binding domain-containing protein 5-like n=1 Tax=Tasmannia lanceolata TaxID=3420 RepID=UPI0040642CBB
MDSESTPSSHELLPIQHDILSESLLESATPANKPTPPPTANDPVGEGVITTSKGLDWLPAGWTMKEKMRTSGEKYKLYFDPVFNRRFRSKKKVLEFLKIGAVQRPESIPKAEESGDSHTSSGNSRPNMQDGSLSKKRKGKEKKAMKFDHDDIPEKVTWVFTNPAQGSWTPILDGKNVSKSIKEEWDAAFERRSRGLD